MPGRGGRVGHGLVLCSSLQGTRVHERGRVDSTIKGPVTMRLGRVGSTRDPWPGDGVELTLQLRNP